MQYSRLLLMTLSLAISLPAVASAEVFHVANGGDDGGPGTSGRPFASPAGCFAAMSAGDTCLFETGRWAGKAPERYLPRWNVCEGPSGSPGAPTVYAAAPGATPVFESFGAGGSGGFSGCEHIRIEGVRTTESFLVWRADDVHVTRSEMSGGMDRDGNWSAVRVENVEGLLFDHNYVSYLNDCPGCREQALVTVFTTSHSVFEFNTLNAEEGVRPQYAAIMLKDSPIDVDVRYNLVLGHQILGSNQNLDPRVGRELRIYGNVVVRGSIKSWVRTLNTSIHHNTIVEGALIADGSHSPGLEMVANLVSGTTVNAAFDEDYWASLHEIHLDYNVYDGQGDYYADRYGPSSRTLHDLAAWRSALQSAGCVDCEDGSQELDCDFTPGSDSDYHLAGGPCTTAGPAGEEVGAYALTHCVGHTCGEPPLIEDGGVGGSQDAGVFDGDGGVAIPSDGGGSVDRVRPGVDPADPPPAASGCSMSATPIQPAGSALALGLLMSYVSFYRRRP